jgi:hypothetical protein
MTARIVKTKTRQCGKRKEGGIYIVSEPGGNGTLAPFNLLTPPIPYTANPHRVYRIVDHWAVLARLPQRDWWDGSTKATEVNKAGNNWWFDTFGMTETKRLSGGECAGVGDADAALAALAKNLRYSANLVDVFRQITADGIQDKPKVSLFYNQLHQALLEHTITRTTDTLLVAQAAIWRIAYTIPPRFRYHYIKNLARMLVLLGLTKDAAYLLQIFGGQNDNL